MLECACSFFDSMSSNQHVCRVIDIRDELVEYARDGGLDRVTVVLIV